jgi:acetyl-CoA C-acetyltransferase
VSTESVVILSGARTPFARFDGALRELKIPVIGSVAVAAALKASPIDPDQVEELALGVNFPGSDRSVARQVALKAGIPDDKNSYTVDRACCSSMAAISLASRGLRLEEIDVAVAGGAENMGRVPYFLENMRWGNRLGDVKLVDQLVISCPYTGVPRAIQAGNESAEYGVGRAEQDEWAVRSHQRYGDALAAGYLDEEIVKVNEEDESGRPAQLEIDESYRSNVQLEKLATLPTVYGSVSVTAGNAPGLSAGASALVLARKSLAITEGWDTGTEILSYSRASGHPDRIASIPAVAARIALKRAGISLDQVDLLEINEAFAAVPLVATLELADRDAALAARLRERTNINGGAIAIGHPTGATAARLVMTLRNNLLRRGGGIGVATICGGIGEAECVVIKVQA